MRQDQPASLRKMSGRGVQTLVLTPFEFVLLVECLAHRVP